MTQRFARKVRFVKAAVEPAASSSRVRVELEDREIGTCIGLADNKGSGIDAIQAGARAAAEAVRQTASHADAKVEVRAVELVAIAGTQVVVVAVVASFKGQERSLHGICQVREDRAASGALAVLNATNRVFDLA